MAQNLAVSKLKNEIQSRKEKAVTIEELLMSQLPKIAEALPKIMTPERLLRIALVSIRKNPKLADCTPHSILGAVFQCAILGLEPDTEGQAYIIAYENKKYINGKWTSVKEAQFQIGYKGLIELFYRHKAAEILDVHAVHENDFFDYEYGTNAFIKHKPAPGNRGEVVSYWAIGGLNGKSVFKVMSRTECIEHGKKHSKSYNKGAWQTELNAMCKKTVLIQLVKLLPKSIELQKALAMDNTTKSIIGKDMSAIPDETNWEEENKNADLPPAKVGE